MHFECCGCILGEFGVYVLVGLGCIWGAFGVHFESVVGAFWGGFRVHLGCTLRATSSKKNV